MSGRTAIPMIGRFFGLLEVLQESIDSTPKTKNWVVRCVACGSVSTVLGGNLRRIERARTNGCYCAGRPNKKHGLWKSALYRVWDGMMRRCYREGHVAFHRYGGRGITVCPEWHDVRFFCAWATGNGWEKGKHLDRANNDLGYSPSNCRFVDPSTNQNNRGNCHFLSISGERMTISDASRKFGIGKTTIRERLRRGWTDEASVRPL